MIKAIIEAKLTEDKFSVYNSLYDLKTLSDYYSKLPHSSRTKFVKFLKFSGGQAAIYNIGDILISPNVADGAEGKKKVQIVYTGDEASKVWNVEKFSKMCKKVFDALKDTKPEDVEVEAVLEGQNKPTKFRFYYDSDNGFAILVNGTNTKGLEDFLNNYEGDLQGAVSVPKVTKAPKAPKEPKQKKMSKGIKINSEPKKRNNHEGYVCVDSSDSFGHRIRIWKRDPDYKPADAASADTTQDKAEVSANEKELDEVWHARPGQYDRRGKYEPTAADMAAWRNTQDHEYMAKRDKLSTLKSISNDKKDAALSLIIDIAAEFFANKSDAEESMTNIGRVIEDNKLDTKRF